MPRPIVWLLKYRHKLIKQLWRTHTSSVAVIFETLPLQLLICDVIFEGLFRQDFVLPRPPIFGGYLTSLLLLEYAIEFAEADAAKDWNRLEPITAQNIVCEQYNETV